jgi:hypothetical protein
MEPLTIKEVFETIIPAWYRVVFHDKELEKIALERGVICRDCENITPIINNIKVGKKCKLCGCPIVGLTRASDYRCKAKKWSR